MNGGVDWRTFAGEQGPERLLLVDDDPFNLRLIRDALAGNGYEFIVATNGKDALRLAREQHPTLILLDIMMPDMDGFEVLRRLRSEHWACTAPVIFVTGCLEQQDEALGLELGAADYIRKPLSFPILRARVRLQLELARQREVLQNLSTVDGLTGLANRRRFDQYLDEQWRFAIRTARPISLLMSDIDFFKAFNDRYGHLEGDECLKRVAGLFQRMLHRSSDLVARWGGEEFACLLPTTDEPGARSLAEALRQGVGELAIPHASSRVGGYVSVSLGVATLMPRPNDHLKQLVEAADAALYRAKAGGRDRVVSAE